MKRKQKEMWRGIEGAKTNREGANHEGMNHEGGGMLAGEIRAAFPEMVLALSDEEYAELAENLTLLPDEEIARYLPALMVRMAELLPERRPYSDMVGIFLDGANLRREKDGSLAPRSDRSPGSPASRAPPCSAFSAKSSFPPSRTPFISPRRSSSGTRRRNSPGTTVGIMHFCNREAEKR